MYKDSEVQGLKQPTCPISLSLPTVSKILNCLLSPAPWSNCLCEQVLCSPQQSLWRRRPVLQGRLLVWRWDPTLPWIHQGWLLWTRCNHHGGETSVKEVDTFLHSAHYIIIDPPRGLAKGSLWLFRFTYILRITLSATWSSLSCFKPSALFYITSTVKTGLCIQLLQSLYYCYVVWW